MGSRGRMSLLDCWEHVFTPPSTCQLSCSGEVPHVGHFQPLLLTSLLEPPSKL